jgi:hypothetical protein
MDWKIAQIFKDGDRNTGHYRPGCLTLIIRVPSSGMISETVQLLYFWTHLAMEYVMSGS